MNIAPVNIINSRFKATYSHCAISNAICFSFRGSPLQSDSVEIEKEDKPKLTLKDIYKMSDEEFREYSDSIRKKFNTKRNYRGCLDYSSITRDNALLLDTFISNKVLYNSPIGNVIDGISASSDSPEACEAKLLLMNKYSSDKRLYLNFSLSKRIPLSIFITSKKDTAEAQARVMDRYLFDERLQKIPAIKERLGLIITDTDNSKVAEAKINAMDKFASNKRMQKPWLQSQILSVFSSSRTPKLIEAKMRTLEKLFSNDALQDDFETTKEIAQLTCAVYDLEHINLIDKVLSNEQICSDPGTVSVITRLLSFSIPSLAKITDKIISNENLYFDYILMSRMLEIYPCVFSEEQASVLDKFLSDERLYGKSALGIYMDVIIGEVKSPQAQEYISDLLDRIANSPKEFNVALSARYAWRVCSCSNYSSIYKYLKSSEICKLSGITYKEKITLVKSIEEALPILKESKLFSEEEIKKLEQAKNDIPEFLKQTITPAQISNKQRKAMFQGFFANNNPELERTLQNADFTQYGKEGLPLKYSRKEFLQDLNKALKNLSNEEKNKILKKLEINIITDNQGNITGYDGIINLEKLSSDGVEGEVLALANKFIKENFIATGDSKLDKALNSLIKGMPEFINIIGKKQHLTHNYSLDIHILKVLQEALKNPQYQNLSNLDKTCLKFTAILHDIAKSENVIDENHPLVSALFARDILKKYSLPVFINDRIFELIKNHHWLKELSNGGKAENIAVSNRHKDDFAIAKIIAEADLKGVSEEFYQNRKYMLTPEKSAPVGAVLNTINSLGQLIFTTKIIQKDKIPAVSYKGRDYQVIDFTKIPDDTDLSEYGFIKGTKKDNVRLFVHMAHHVSDLKTVNNLTDIANGGFLCASYISLDDCCTYFNMRFGVSLETENVNIANASKENQGSGGKKEFNQFIRMIAHGNAFRLLIPKIIQQELGLSKEEYAKLYEQLALKQHISQIREDDSYYIDDIELKGEEVLKAIKKAQDSLLSKKQNEANLYNPKINAFIAKVDSIEEIPEEMLDFAHEYNLPI